MKIVLQRVNYCNLTSEDYVSQIGFGLLITVGVGLDDTMADIEYLARKILNLRIFKNEDNKCNLSVKDIGGDIMIVSNFTLQARISSGTRPDFSHAGNSEHARELFDMFVATVRSQFDGKVATGNFKHHMHIECELDGPFNLILESEGRE